MLFTSQIRKKPDQNRTSKTEDTGHHSNVFLPASQKRQRGNLPLLWRHNCYESKVHDLIYICDHIHTQIEMDSTSASDTSASSSSSVDMDDVLTDVSGGADIVPYSFGPEYETDEEVPVDDEPPEIDSRLGNTDWCFD